MTARRLNQWLLLPDGRRLGFAESGDPTGRPVLLFHGTPGSRLKRHPDESIAQALGVRVLALDRPGYGLSDPQPNRRLLDWPADVAAFADRLGLARFAVMGISGGGPYAAVCAYALPQHVTRTGIVGGAELMHQRESGAGMLLLNRIGLQAARTLPVPALAQLNTLLYSTVRRHPERLFEGVSRRLPPADRRVLADPALRSNSIDAVRESLRRGGAGLASDMAILARPWGFDLAAIHGAVYLWHGTVDVNVPLAAAQAVALAISGCRTTYYPGEGHLILYPHWREILAALA